MFSFLARGAGKHLRSLLLLVALVSPALADWNEGDPAKWIQLPDPTSQGIDVDATAPFLLADDFLCTQPGPVTGFHLWASWLQDMLPNGDPNAVMFTLSIHKDIPANESPTGYSMPGQTLWWRPFQPGQFTARIWAQGTPEGWLWPPAGYQFPADHVCWQYNFQIPEAEAFFQEGSPGNPVVYWLDVQAVPLQPGTYLGWKTSQTHWNDDAVWVQGLEPYEGLWNELHYPPQHPMFPESIDLAFVIQAGGTIEEWDFGDLPESYQTTLAVNGPRHLIVPNFNLGNLIDAEPNGLPHPQALGDDLSNLPDEDGVTFLTPFVPGSDVTVQVSMSTAGYLSFWIDWLGLPPGDWSQPEDYVYPPTPLPGGVYNITFSCPAQGRQGHTSFARFRFSTTPLISYTGPAPDGEVEDYAIWIEDDPNSAPELPQSFGLYQNVPNPFNPATEIRYDIPAGGAQASLEIFDLSGRKVAVLFDGYQAEGSHSLIWRARDDEGKRLPSGVYFYRFRTAGYTETRKMVLMQ